MFLIALVSMFTITLATAGGHSPTKNETFKSYVIKADVLAIDVTAVTANQTEIFTLANDYSVTFVK